jgi:multidrug efflux pump subunit AcrA (membrane-fusion protein)
LAASHAALALANAREYGSLPLLSVLRTLRRGSALFAPGTRKKTFAIAGAVLLLLVVATFVPVEFGVHTRGTLEPVVRHHVFSPLDGTVKRIFVKHGDHVAAGDPLLEIQNVDLDVSLSDAVGKHSAAHEQLVSAERALYEDSSRVGPDERHRLTGWRNELKQQLASLDEQIGLLRKKRERLVVRSPVTGEVTTWNVAELLAARPVRQGQILIDVADVEGPWELELKVPEDSVGNVLEARREIAADLRVIYRPAADPRSDRSARLGDVHWSAEVRDEDGNTVLMKASLDEQHVARLRPGAEVTAKIYCGRRALGYVWLHDVVDFVRTKIIFRTY